MSPAAHGQDQRVDTYIDRLPTWQQDVGREVRDLVHAAVPGVLAGNICALLATKDHVNVFLYDGGIVADPDGIITAVHDNQTARTVAFWEGDPINASALSTMLRQIIANN